MSKTISVKTLLSSNEPQKFVQSLSFEQGLSLVEDLIKKVEGGTLPLEQSINAYERGVMLLNKLKQQLGDAESKLKILQIDDDGKTSNLNLDL